MKILCNDLPTYLTEISLPVIPFLINAVNSIVNVFQDSIRGDVATSNFIKSLSKFEQLESINLSANCVAAKSLQALDQLLQSNPTLKTLNLAVNSNVLKKAIFIQTQKRKTG